MNSAVIRQELTRGCDADETCRLDLVFPSLATPGVRVSALQAAVTWWWAQGCDYDPRQVVAALLQAGAETNACPGRARHGFSVGAATLHLLHTALWQLCALSFHASDTVPDGTPADSWLEQAKEARDERPSEQKLLARQYKSRRMSWDGLVCDLIRLLVDSGARRTEVDAAGPTAEGCWPQHEGEEWDKARREIGGNADILTLVEVAVAAKHSAQVIDCLLSCPDPHVVSSPRGIIAPSEAGGASAAETRSLRGQRRGEVSQVGTSVRLLRMRRRAVRCYWAVDSVAEMLRMQDEQGATTLHRGYLRTMLQNTPDPTGLQAMLRAGADPAAVDSHGWRPDESAAGTHEVLKRFANGYHEFDPDRQKILGMCAAWRSRREVAGLQRLCFAAGVACRGGGSPLFQLSDDLAEMIAAQLSAPPAAEVCARWERFRRSRDDTRTRTRARGTALVLGPSVGGAVALWWVGGRLGGASTAFSREELVRVLLLAAALCLADHLRRACAGAWPARWVAAPRLSACCTAPSGWQRSEFAAAGLALAAAAHLGMRMDVGVLSLVSLATQVDLG